MAENFRQGGKIQIVFLVDVFVREQDIYSQDFEYVIDLKSRAISLCVLRLLLHFNSSIDCGNSTSLRWGFKFYNSNVLNFEYKRRRFYELSGESFERFEEEMRARFRNGYDSQKWAKFEARCGVKSLSCCITEVLHDFPWVTPDISSPSRSTKNEQFDDHRGNAYKNYLFVIGDCPLLDVDLCRFLGRSESSLCDAEVVFNEIFSTTLYEEFCDKCGLSLFWIDSGLWCTVDSQRHATPVEDWKGYHLISSVTKKLGGNIIPISSLVQETKNLQATHSENQTLSPGSLKQKMKTFAEVKVLAATLKFSFGKIVEAFLRGQDLFGESSMFNIKSILNCDDLLKGTLSFQGKNVCSVVLSNIFKSELTTSDLPRHDCKANSKASMSSDNLNKENETVPSHEPSITTRQLTRGDSNMKTSDRISPQKSPDIMMETGTEEQISENCFKIKGVIASSVVSPTWMHPTKLYSCFGVENSGRTEDGSTTELTKHSGAFEQLLSLASGKHLGIVVEYRDPDTGTFVTGLLQPMTSLCAILSMINQDKLLLFEKALLRHKLCGYTLIPCDVTSGKGRSTMLPFHLRECKEECRLQKEGNNDSMSAESSKWRQKKSIVDSCICSFQKKWKTKARQQEEQGLRGKLKDYYSRKKLDSEKSAVQPQPFARGKLLQETSQRNEILKLSESEGQNDVEDSAMKTEDPTDALSNLDWEQTETMDEDLPDMSMIQSVDDLKANLKDGYQRCLNHEQSVPCYVTRSFHTIEHFKNSGQLKDINEIDDLMKSTVLRDSKNPPKNSGDEENESKKELILLEHKLQVLLRLEFADKIGIVGEEKTVDEITSFLRPISYLKDPAYLSSFLKSIIIPRYSGNLSGFLRQIYDGLMQRPPKDILSPSQVTSEEDTPLKSRKPLSSSEKTRSVEEAHSESSQSSRALVRRHSVLGVPAKRREIVIPVKGKPDKTRKKAGSSGKKSGKNSSKIKKTVTPVKKVRRNLFEGNASRSSPKKHTKTDGSSKSRKNNTLTRCHSIAAFTNSKTVADTPVGKQVSQRMLRRQEWARRRSKTVIDVTVVGETPNKANAVLPRKSPRQKATTFYSQQASSTTNPNLLTSTEMTRQEKMDSLSDHKGNRALSPAKNINADAGFDIIPSQSEEYTKLVRVDESPRELDKEDVFAEVFLETADPNENTILSVCTSDRKVEIATKYPLSHNMAAKRPSEFSKKCDKTAKCSTSLAPEKPTTSTVATVHPGRSVSRRSNSSPSLSTTPPQKPSKSPFTNHKSFPITSPILFKTPKKTPKSSPINFSPDQIFDIAIPLTPVKNLQTKRKNTDSAKINTSPCKKADKEMTSPSETVDRQSALAVKKSKGVETQSQDVGLESESIDSQSVVAASPLLNRKRSLISRTKAFKSKKGNNNFSNTSGMNSDYKTNDITGDAKGSLTVSLVRVQRPGDEKGVEVSNSSSAVPPERTRVFKSPVTTKRKRIMMSRTGNVSPLNQILKQRKNNRNTSPAACKAEKSEKAPNSSKKESPIEETLIRKARKRKPEADESHEKETGTQCDKSSLESSDEILRADKASITTPTKQHKLSKSVSSSCNLNPHFTRSSLSADSLKHLQESPVLLGTSPQFNDSRARKWSERNSPATAPRTSLRKRLRHDS